MSEGKKKEPRTIHVDKLIIKADEVVFEREPHRPHNPHHPVSGQQPIRRDFWGFPIPEIRTGETEEETLESEKKEDEK
ncbi:hypothetical protein [Sporolactobacillus vineae]|uniref:hypothetical protein n=1 Tax=Sporolactobacillus vineae TaxID=444463 RepID=UPI000287FFBF|nr:hypothetical protein [Sporolactobacillus vineae]